MSSRVLVRTHWAQCNTTHSHFLLLRILLEFGAGINTHSNEFKESALTLACYKGHLEMVRFLLEAGADQEQLTSHLIDTLISFIIHSHLWSSIEYFQFFPNTD